ncbi:MAG: hypothetical protein WCG26_01160, partial [Chloroflexales bacterium]
MVTHDTQRFIGRAAELDTLFQQVVGLRLGAPAQRCIINLCGVHGIGKSALLATLRQRMTSEFGLKTLSLVLPPLPP